MNTIANLLRIDNILLGVEANDKAELLDAIGRHLEQDRGLPRQNVTQALARREQVGSTGLGEGFAIPHARIQHLERIRIAYLRLKAPVAFDAPDGKPVFELLAVLVPKQATEEHLRILADATQMFSDRRFRERLQGCGDAAAVKRQFDAWPYAAVAEQETPDLPLRSQFAGNPSLFRRFWPFSSCR